MSLLLTNTQNLRAKSNLDRNEYRRSRYGAFAAFIDGNSRPDSIVSPQLERLARQSAGSLLETPVIQADQDVITKVTNTLSPVLLDDENTSQMYQFTFVTMGWSFSQVPTMFSNNEIDIQTDFNKKYMKYLYAVAKKLDELAYTTITTNKSQVLAQPLNYDFTGNTVNVNFADREMFLTDADALMNGNDYYGSLAVLGNSGLQSTVARIQQHGLFNDQDKGMQLMGKDLYYSNAIPTETDEFSEGAILDTSNLGVIFKFEREATRGTTTPDGHSWNIDTLPLINVPVSTYEYQTVGDYSGVAGDATNNDESMKRCVKQFYGFSLMFSFVTPFNSDPATNANPILAFSIKKA